VTVNYIICDTFVDFTLHLINSFQLIRFWFDFDSFFCIIISLEFSDSLLRLQLDKHKIVIHIQAHEKATIELVEECFKKLFQV